MNNKAKRQYISDLLTFQSPPFMSELGTRKNFLKLTPCTLYKLRPFDKYAFDMIDNGYAYLAPVKGLDDPFDCLNDFEISQFYNEKTSRITPKAVDFILNIVCPNGTQDFSRKEIRKLAIQCIDEDGIDYEKVPKIVRGGGCTTITEPDPLFVVLNTFNQNFKGILEGSQLDGLAESAMHPGNRVGICSLTEKRDNKVMWSLYSNQYAGYCIEYEIPKRKELIPNLCPVIYTKKANNSFIEKLLEYAVSAMLRAVSSGNLSGNIGAAMELFCTKDSDWSYQSEWRIIANADARCTYMPIRAIYLGFKVSKYHERQMKQRARKLGFELYKMNPPNGSKKISYTKIS